MQFVHSDFKLIAVSLNDYIYFALGLIRLVQYCIDIAFEWSLQNVAPPPSPLRPSAIPKARRAKIMQPSKMNCIHK